MRTYNRKRKIQLLPKENKRQPPLHNLLCARLYPCAILSSIIYLFLIKVVEEEEEYSVKISELLIGSDTPRCCCVLFNFLPFSDSYFFFASVRQSETAASREDGSAKRTSPPPSIFFFFFGRAFAGPSSALVYVV
jgi:hypothetical protein